MNLFLTGASGFVGRNLLKYFEDQYRIKTYSRNTEILINDDIVIHLAGKAHDSKNETNSEDYYTVNTDFTTKVFDSFIASNSKVFITLSSVKAVADNLDVELTEDYVPNSITHYGKSKFLAEQYIRSKEIPAGKRVYILRPCMIHGPGNKGNLNQLYKIVSKGLPWPLGVFENLRSFCSIDNLMFIFKELIVRDDIPSGVYNVADDVPLSTNEVISILAEARKRKPRIWKISKELVQIVAKVGDILKLPLNQERLHKLTHSFVVSNKKLVKAIGKPLPVSSREGLLKTFQSFQK